MTSSTASSVWQGLRPQRKFWSLGARCHFTYFLVTTVIRKEETEEIINNQVSGFKFRAEKVFVDKMSNCHLG